MPDHPHLPVADIADKFNTFAWTELDQPHLTAQDILPVTTQLASHPQIVHEKIGESYFGVPIMRYTLGHGPFVILAWTQMHGDEATATAAVLDWMNILVNDKPTGLSSDWKEHVTVHIIPMLNPDGAARRTRVNGQGIDINRDAKSLQTPEGRILLEQVQSLSPQIAFNLHDQNPYYTVGASSIPATIAFLAPAYHEDKHVDGPRLRAKQVIAGMAAALSHFIPGGIGRYDDTYSYRSFGDNIAATGASTILIESGAYPDDDNRQMARKMNVIALQWALESVLTNLYQDYSMADYYRIPDNREEGLCNLKVTGITCGTAHAFHTDIAIDIDRKTSVSEIRSLGDLNTTSGFSNINGDGRTILPYKGKRIDQPLTLTDSIYLDFLRQGYSYLIDSEHQLTNASTYPVRVCENALDHDLLAPGDPAFFIIQRHGSVEGAVLEGRYFEL